MAEEDEDAWRHKVGSASLRLCCSAIKIILTQRGGGAEWQRNVKDVKR